MCHEGWQRVELFLTLPAQEHVLVVCRKDNSERLRPTRQETMERWSDTSTRQYNAVITPRIYIKNVSFDNMTVSTYGHELWGVTRENKVANTSEKLSFLCRVSGLSLRERVRSSDIEGVWAFSQEASRVPSFGGLLGTPKSEETLDRPRTPWRVYILHLA